MQKHKLLLLQNIVRKGISAPHVFFFHPPFLQEHASQPPPHSTMKIGTDTYIQGKQEHCDQDVIKSYSSFQLKKIPRLTASPFPTEFPLLRMPLPFSNFSIPLFFRFLVSSIPLLVLFYQSNNNSSIDVKRMSLFLRQNHLLRGELTLSWG